MTRLTSLDQIERLYKEQGALTYGEGVTQLEHALQCADLAQAQGAPPSLIVAALLHDIGHLFESAAEVASFKVDDHHEFTGADLLSDLFGETVCVPVSLHVAAKRYLCFAEPDYFDALSAASQKSLSLQGGPFNASEAAAFALLPYAQEAIALRRFDDTGKREEPCERAFADFTPLMRELMILAENQA